MLDVDTMKLDPTGPFNRIRLEQVLNLIVVDVESEHVMRSLVHQLLAEVRADEASGANHAYRERLNRPAIQIQSTGSVRH